MFLICILKLSPSNTLFSLWTLTSKTLYYMNLRLANKHIYLYFLDSVFGSEWNWSEVDFKEIHLMNFFLPPNGGYRWLSDSSDFTDWFPHALIKKSLTLIPKSNHLLEFPRIPTMCLWCLHPQACPDRQGVYSWCPSIACKAQSLHFTRSLLSAHGVQGLVAQSKQRSISFTLLFGKGVSRKYCNGLREVAYHPAHSCGLCITINSYLFHSQK